jgi:hypothetical protein
MNEGRTDKVVKEKDTQVKVNEFRITIKNLLKSKNLDFKQVGDDFEVIIDKKRVGQIMFRKDKVTVKKENNKFGKDFNYNELGKIKTEINNLK